MPERIAVPEAAVTVQVAKNCPTSVQMIEQFYASHIKNMVDASVVNVRRPRSQRVVEKRSGAKKPPSKRDN
jgi:hypothetical protein